MILVSEVKKTFGDIRAVRSVSLEIAAGEVFGLLGPNGAGKTTLLSMLMGLIRPDSGSATIAGGDPAQPAVREAIGLAPQSLSLYDEFTAWENLRFFARLYGLSGALLRERIEWALDFASLADRRHDLVKTYSGGMKRRLNMAMALIHDPQAILFDEPTVGVDPQSRNHIFDCIERLKQDGRTIIYTTHYMEEAQRLCDRVAIMDHGEILAIGSVDELLQQYGGQSAVYGQLDSDVAADGCPGVGDDRRFHFRSENPLQDVMRMSGDGVSFRTLQISAPDLESVFLSLTGRTLRDD